MAVTQTMAPEMLVTYVGAAADAIVEGAAPSFHWALEEAAQLLEAERLRLTSRAPQDPSATVLALSRNLGPVYQLSDLILRSAAADEPQHASPAAEREARLRLLDQILASLKQATLGDVDAARQVAETFRSATNLALGRTGQPDLI